MFDRDFLNRQLVAYNDKQRNAIFSDLLNLDKFTFQQAAPVEDKVYLATAGGPGSAKTTTLEFTLANASNHHFAYIDPDETVLKNMVYTYRQSTRALNFAQAKSNYDALDKAYKTWRDASNYVACSMINKAIADGFSLAHGSTSTSPFMREIYQGLKQAGYRIVLLLCYAEDDTRLRLNGIRETEQGLVKTTPEDVVKKGQLFPANFDLYFEFADEIFFYWNNDVDHEVLPDPCARYERASNGSKAFEELEANEWRQFCTKYSKDVRAFGLKTSPAMLEIASKKLQLNFTHSFLGQIVKQVRDDKDAAPDKPLEAPRLN